MDASLRHKTISGMIWAGFQKFGTVFISFLSNIVLARLLTPDDFGYIGMLMVFIAVSNSFVDGGFGSALIQKSKPTQEDYSTVFYWNLFLSVTLYLILYFCAPLISDFYKMEILTKILRVEGIILIINGFTIVQFNKLRKQMQFKKIAYVNLIAAVISVVIAIGMAYYGYGVWALVWQQIILGVVNLVMLVIISPWTPSFMFSFSSFKGLFKFGSYILLSSFVNSVANNISALIVGRFFSAGTLGFLTQAQKVETIASTSISTTVEQVSYPLLVEVKEDYTHMGKVLKLFNLLLLTIVLPAMLLIVIGADLLIVFLFGEKWLPSAPILKILSFAGIFIAIQGSNYNVVAAIGRSDALFKWTIVKRLGGIGLIILGLVWIGFKGVLYGMVGSSILIWLCNSWLVSRFIGYRLWTQMKDLMPVVITGGVSYILTLILHTYQLFGFNDLIYCCIFILIYSVPFLLSKNAAFILIRQNIKSIVHRKK